MPGRFDGCGEGVVGHFHCRVAVRQDEVVRVKCCQTGGQSRTCAALFGDELAQFEQCNWRPDAGLFTLAEDGSLADTTDMRRALTRQIRRFRPDLVLTHQPLRSLQFPVGASHPDHLAVGESALNAVYPFARNPRAFPELLAEGLPAHKVAEVWLPGHEHTDLLVAVEHTAERKVEAILAHRSQFRGSADPRADIQWAVDRMRGNGALIGVGQAEAFKRIVTDSAAAAGPPLTGPSRGRADGG